MGQARPRLSVCHDKSPLFPRQQLVQDTARRPQPQHLVPDRPAEKWVVVREGLVDEVDGQVLGFHRVLVFRAS
jgi:hypothetical protein